jgi:hypothetical protein
MTKAGNSRMRRLMVQVAVSIPRLRSPQTEALRAWAASCPHAGKPSNIARGLLRERPRSEMAPKGADYFASASSLSALSHSW